MTATGERRYDIVTLFPEMFEALTGSGTTRRAIERNLYRLACWNPRDFATDRHHTVNDRPYGGGPGMVMLVEPLEKAILAAKAAQRQAGSEAGKVIYLSPQGRRLDHGKVMELVAEPSLILLCGRYEGIDQRLIDRCVDEEVSLGDFVLSGANYRPWCCSTRSCGNCRGTGRCRFGGGGFLRRRAARLPPLHAAGGIWEHTGPSGAAVGQSRRNQALAPAAVTGQDRGAASRSAGRSDAGQTGIASA